MDEFRRLAVTMHQRVRQLEANGVRLHRKWLSNRERFIEALKEADLPKSICEFAVPMLGQMADRISNLEKSLLGDISHD